MVPGIELSRSKPPETHRLLPDPETQIARPPLALGTPGNITVTAAGDKNVARCRYRDHDGTTRKIERQGPTKTAARARLHDALGVLRGVTAEPLLHEALPANPVREVSRIRGSRANRER